METLVDVLTVAVMLLSMAVTAVGIILAVAAPPLLVRDWLVLYPRRKRWMRFAAEEGLVFRGASVLSSWAIRGEMRGVPVSIESRGFLRRAGRVLRGLFGLKLRGSDPEAVIVIEAQADRGITLRRRGFFTGRKQFTGDPYRGEAGALSVPPDRGAVSVVKTRG